jgi:hypothetical protein
MLSYSYSSIILHFAPHALNILISPHVYAYMLDHMEPKPEVQAEQAQAEGLTNLELDQGKPWYI